MTKIFEKLVVLRSMSTNGCLFTKKVTADDPFALSILEIDQEFFYGKALGFYVSISSKYLT